MADPVVYLRIPVNAPNLGDKLKPPVPWAVIWSIDVIGSISAFQADRAGSNPVCSSSGTHTPVLVIVLLTESFR